MSDVTLSWLDDAVARVSKVPEGFMRKMTRKRVEEAALAEGITEITLDFVEKSIENSRAGMGSMMGGDMSGMPSHVKDLLNSQEPDPQKEQIKTYYFCFVCNYAVEENPPEKCPNCGSESEKFSVLEPEFKTDAHTTILKWTEGALKSIESTPDDFRRKMTKYEIEAFARRNGYKVVSRDVVDERYSVWKGISDKVVSDMEWEEEVKTRIKNIPDHIRGMVIKEMENFAKKSKKNIVTMDVLDSIREKWVNTKEFHVKWQ